MDANGDPPRFARGYPEVDPFDPFGKGKVFIRVPSECDDVIRRGARQQKAEGYRIERSLMDCVAPPSKGGDAIHQ